MTDPRQGRISFTRAIYLALAALCLYYPITISANIPFEHWKNIRFLALPAIVHFVFYTLLIIAIDRVIEGSERWVRPGVHEVDVKTIMLSVVVAVMAVVLSQVLFKLSSRLWMVLIERISSAGGRIGSQSQPRLLLWNAVGRANYALTFVISLSIFYLILNRKAQFRMRQMEVQAEQLKKANAIAQLEALKNQVSPHFLFNSLTILSSLVHVDATLSEKFIDQLSKAYRYILQQKDNDLVPLKTELEFLQSYLFLLKIRFEKKFDVEIHSTEDEANRYRIAPLTLQLLIENCVKHNRMSEQEPLIVTIAVEGAYLIVSNKIRPRTEIDYSRLTGIGLSNIKSRYELLTTTAVTVSQAKDVFEVKIPLV